MTSVAPHKKAKALKPSSRRQGKLILKCIKCTWQKYSCVIISQKIRGFKELVISDRALLLPIWVKKVAQGVNSKKVFEKPK